MVRHAEYMLRLDAAKVAEARHAVRSCLEEWELDDDLVHDAVLLVSELVTNAVLHSVGPASLRLDATGGRLRIEVRDGSRQLPVHKRYSPEAATGRGLMLVEALATRWGASQEGEGDEGEGDEGEGDEGEGDEGEGEEGEGKVVWVELSLPPSAQGDGTTRAGRSDHPGAEPRPEAVGVDDGGSPDRDRRHQGRARSRPTCSPRRSRVRCGLLP